LLKQIHIAGFPVAGVKLKIFNDLILCNWLSLGGSYWRFNIV